MLRMLENACGFFGAMIRNMFIIALAGVLVIVFGFMRIMDLNERLDEGEIAVLSALRDEQEDAIAEQAEVISAQDQQIAQLQQELEALSKDPRFLIRQEIRLLGFIRLGSVCFSQSVSREIFDSFGEGDEISASSLLMDNVPNGLIQIRFFVADRIE